MELVGHLGTPLGLAPLLITTGESIPLRGSEGVPSLPGAPQDEDGLTGKFETSHVCGATCQMSLADEEQTPRDCLGHRSLRTAALSLKLLKNQEADQHSARLFVQSLEGLLPRLLALPSVEEVDSALQNFVSTFCSGL